LRDPGGVLEALEEQERLRVVAPDVLLAQLHEVGGQGHRIT
jgi:hypothetical protein